MTSQPLVSDLANNASEAASGIAWRPDRRTIQQSQLQRLIDRTGSETYHELLRRAADEPEWYWREALADLDLQWQQQPDEIWNLDRGIAWPRWFPGGAFNLVDSALDRWVNQGYGDRVAVIAESDSGDITRRTYRQLYDETVRVAAGLRRAGIGPGDRVGILMPMIPETVVAMLACARIKAVVVPLFSGYGKDAIASRLLDCGATALITVDGFHRRGKSVPLKQLADEALVSVPAVNRCFVVNHSGGDCPMNDGRDRWWHNVADDSEPEVGIPETPADTPFMIMYTSGTTGRPKGAVHIHAGFPIKAAHDLAYCFDVRQDDVVFWLTDLGWMMGPWLILGGLIRGASIVMMEGTPDYPGPGRMWEMVERHKITTLGVAPTAVRALIPFGSDPVDRTDRSSLRVLGSTGETWNPDPWWWFFDVVGERRCPIINYSGGTETSGGIVSGLPILPQRSCAFNGPVPGMIADVVDDMGQTIPQGVGELVVRSPWVGMTNGFWNDPDRYEETYWQRFPGAWVHGDWAEIDDDGFWFIRGRSDDTLNIAGKRIGPSEIESAVVAEGSTREAAAIAVPHDVKGNVIAVVTVLQSGTEANDEVRSRISDGVADRLGKSFRPEYVICVDALPKTRNAKIMRRMIRAACLGEESGDTSALENPESVQAIHDEFRQRYGRKQ